MIVINQLRNRFIKFMYGRYGADQLYKGLFGVIFALILINLLAQSAIISGLTLGLFIIAYFRVFSKNIYKRQRENAQYIKFMAPIKKSFKLTFRKIKDIRSYRYRSCPNCQQTLRLKRKIGTHQTVCPKCRTKMDVRIHI